MSEEGLNLTGFSAIANNMQLYGIKINEDELKSAFDELKSKDDSVDVNNLTSYLMEKYKLSDKEIIKVLDEATGEVVEEFTNEQVISQSLSAVSALDGDKNVITSDDIDTSLNQELQAVLDSGALDEGIADALENVVISQEDQLKKVVDNNGVIAGGWDGFKNLVGSKSGSDKVQEKITELKQQIEDVKNGKKELAEAYKKRRRSAPSRQQ